MGLVESSGLRTFSKIGTSAETFLGLFCTSKPFLHHFELNCFSSGKSCVNFEHFPKSEKLAEHFWGCFSLPNSFDIILTVFHLKTRFT
jgi:hypothetical protein